MGVGRLVGAILCNYTVVLMDLIVDSTNWTETLVLLGLSHWRCYHYCQQTINPTTTPLSQLWRASVWSVCLSFLVLCLCAYITGWACIDVSDV